MDNLLLNLTTLSGKVLTLDFECSNDAQDRKKNPKFWYSYTLVKDYKLRIFSFLGKWKKIIVEKKKILGILLRLREILNI